MSEVTGVLLSPGGHTRIGGIGTSKHFRKRHGPLAAYISKQPGGVLLIS